MSPQERLKFRRHYQTELRYTLGKKERKEREESAAADLQQASIHAGAGLTTGEEAALIFRCQGAYKQRQQRQEEDGGNFEK